MTDSPNAQLTEKQAEFLRLRPDYPTDTACARAMGLQPITVRSWRSNQERARNVLFRTKHDRLLNQIKAAKDDFDKNEWMEEKLVPKSLRRYDEVLSQPITGKTPDSRVRAIITTATEVLKGTGHLSPESRSDTNIVNVVQNFINEGGQYQAPWQRKAQTSDGHDVESPG